jgi:histidine triad (HIT) family protein
MDDSLDPDCLFCSIVKGDMPATFIYEDKEVVVFSDISPVSPIHYLVIPKRHFVSLMDVPADVVGAVHEAIKIIAEREGIAERGFRIVNNCGHDGGQVVPHVHWHFLAGRQHSWPPG